MAPAQTDTVMMSVKKRRTKDTEEVKKVSGIWFQNYLIKEGNPSRGGIQMPKQSRDVLQSEITLEEIKREILEVLEHRGLAPQDLVIKELDWPSVLVSYCVGMLIQEGRITCKKMNGELILFEPSLKKEAC